MRIGEIILIVVNILSLVLSFTSRSRGARVGIVGANLLALVMHGLLEGFRYQMAFSYLVVGVLTLYTAVQIAKPFKTPTVLKSIGAMLAVLFIAITAVLATALPVFTLPAPTGSYAVGIEYLHLSDESRTEPFLAGSTQPRELMVKVYYPAQADASKHYSAYFHDSPELLRLLTTGYGLPDFLFNHFNRVRTHSKDGLALSDAQPAYPIVLFSHGGGTSMEVHTAQAEDLASHGYIVVAIDHPYVSSGTVFPDRVISAKDATTNFNEGEPVVVINQIMADDASFVIDQLAAMNEGSVPSVLAGRLDLEQIGIVGHSLGGAVAYNLAIHDPRVKAAINLDGAVYVEPDNSAPMSPFLMLAEDGFHLNAIQNREALMRPFEDMPELDQEITLSMYGSREAYDLLYADAVGYLNGLTDALAESGNLYTIEGSAHMKFSDVGLYFGIRQLREMINIGGSTDPARCLEITRALTRAFFDAHLKDDPTALESLPADYPELRQVDLRD